jgi:biotin synthase
LDYFGEKRKVRNESKNIKIGDYVYAQGGILINKIPENEAKEILKAWEELFFEMKKTDKRLSGINHRKVSNNMLEIMQKVNLRKELSRQELNKILQLEDENELKLLYETANNIRQKEHDNACCVHGIIEFSNHCENNCHYCGIRGRNIIKRYRYGVDEIVDIAKNAVKDYGFKALVLQSGEDEYYDENKLRKLVKEIKKLDVLIFLSIGMRSKELYQKLYDAGARAILLRFETSNEEAFNKLRPGKSLGERVQLIKDIEEMGYIMATGCIIGLPGESDDDMIDNILLTRSLRADMYSFGPFIPANGTPLEKHPKPDKDRVLKAIAISRFLDRRSKILVTTALETLDKDAKRQGLLAGANSLMINATPKSSAKLYSIYDNRAGTDDDISKAINNTVSLLHSLGRAPTDLGV